MVEGRRRNSSGLMRNSIMILAGVCIAIVITFLINNMIIHRWYKEETVQSRSDFFMQIVDKMQEEENGIVNLIDSLLSNNTVLNYIHADGLSGRWEQRADIKQFAASLTKMNENIEAVCIYNKDGEIIAMQGSKYVPALESDFNDILQRFSNRIPSEDGKDYFFYTSIPIYERTETKSYEKVGEVALLFHTEWLKETLNLAASAFSGEDTYLAVFDRNGEALTYVGNADIYQDYLSDEQRNSKYLSFQQELAESGWQISCITKQASYMAYMNQVQKVNMLTYLIVITALLVMCFMMYHKVIKSIRRQLEFVANYTKDTSKRMEVWDKSEFGELEQELNEMLDEIEELNQKILQEREEKFYLEYAKKQTEMIAYKNQINPHFMFNTLECLRGMALYRGEREIAKLAEAMARMFQYNVKGNEMVTVKEMLQSIRDYAVIINYRFMGKINIQIEADETVYALQLPKMIVQPFVENAVRHGLEPKIEKGTVILQVIDEEDHLKIVVQDDGVGMTKEECKRQQQKLMLSRNEQWQAISGKEIGVANVARRIGLFYARDYKLELSSEENNGTTVTIILPKEMDRE